MNKKLTSITKTISGIRPFIAPYKWQFIGAIVMVILSVLHGLAPSVEGMITTQLADDITLAESLGGLQIQFDAIIKILVILALIYLVKTLSRSLRLLG